MKLLLDLNGLVNHVEIINMRPDGTREIAGWS